MFFFFINHLFYYLDNLSSSLTTPTKDLGENSPVGSGESIKSSDSISTGHRKKKSSSSQPHPPINGSISKLSPDLSTDGAATNDADSIISFESQKSNTTASMPVLEDGLSDSENLSDDEQSSSPIKPKPNGRHQSTQSDFLFDSNHSSLVTSSHKRQFAKSTATTATNGVEPSQSKSFYIRPPPPSSFVKPVATNRSTPPITPNEVNSNQPKIPSEESSTIPAGKIESFILT
jgi:hypothetical protein